MAVRPRSRRRSAGTPTFGECAGPIGSEDRGAGPSLCCARRRRERDSLALRGTRHRNDDGSASFAGRHHRRGRPKGTRARGRAIGVGFRARSPRLRILDVGDGVTGRRSGVATFRDRALGRSFAARDRSCGVAAALRRRGGQSKVDSRQSMQVGSRRRWWWARCLPRSCSRRSMRSRRGPSLTSSPP